MRAAEEGVRRLVETNSNLRPPALQIFASAQVEWHAGPAPGVDFQLAGDVGFGRRIRRHVWCAAIGLHLFAQNGTGIVLTAHRNLQRLSWFDGTYRLDDFGLLVTD